MSARLANGFLALVSILVLVALLLAAEWVSRWLQPDYLYQLYAEESSNVYSETYGWELRKGFHGMDFGRLATVNRAGYRGAIHSPEKAPGKKRVLMLGDSIAYGAGVDDDKTFSSLLESRGSSFEVVNLAVGGYGTDQELLKLEREGLAYRPDAVILHFCLFSDFTDNQLSSALFDARQPKPYFAWDGQALVLHDEHLKLSALRRFAQYLSDHSYLYNHLRVFLGLRRLPREPGVWADRKATVEKNLPPAVDLTFRLIRRADELSRGAGARFLVIVHPDEFAYRHRSKVLRKFCRGLEGIPVIEMGARYRGAELDFRAFAIDEPGHLTALGHEIVADVIEAILTDKASAEWDYRKTCDARREGDERP